MNDARMYFCTKTGVEFTNSKTFGNALQVDPWTEPGKGTQKFINIWSDGGFTSGAEVASVYLRTGTTSPGDNDVVALIHDKAMSAFSAAGLIAKVPLPSEGLSDYMSLYFYAETAVTAGGKMTAFITLD